MSASSPAITSVAPVPVSGTSTADVSPEAAEAFGAMVAAETGAAEETPLPTDDADVDDASDDPVEDGSGDTIPQNLLTGAALYIVQPQQPTPLSEIAPEPRTGAVAPPIQDMPAPSDAGAGSAGDVADQTSAQAAAAAAQAASTASPAQGTTTLASTAAAMQQALAALGAETTGAAPAETTALDEAVASKEEAPARGAAPADAAPSNASAARAGNSAAVPTPDASAAASNTTVGGNTAAASTPAQPNEDAAPVQTAAAAAADPATPPLPEPTISTGPDTLLSTTPSQTAPSTQTPAPVVQTSLSSLSRATIETTAQIAAQITRRLEGRATRFEMALTPDDLGRVDVSLDIDADGQLVARLAFDNPLAATELRGRADELRSQLEDAGFTLARDALDFSQRDASSGGGFDRRQNRAFASASRMAAQADAAAQAAPAAWISLNLTPRGVDMKV